MMTVYPMPEPGSRWRHRNGNVYEVVAIANIGSQNLEKYPITVVYKNVETGSVWCRIADRWYGSMTLISSHVT